MMRFLAFSLVFLIHGVAFSQDANWNSYIASYEDGPGSTTLNMDLLGVAPKKGFPYLVISEFKFQGCDENGFPDEKAFKKIYDISDAVTSTLTSTTDGELVGTFIYQCTRMNYFYLKDTINIRSRLEDMFKKKFPSTKHATRIEDDRDWEAYLDFLYPNEEILEFMSNEEVLTKLEEAGDKLTRPRPVDHWLYFPNSETRSKYISFAEGLKFKIESADELKDIELPFQLHISRNDMVDRESITKLTLMLKSKAKELGGDYDGWETQVIKD